MSVLLNKPAPARPTMRDIAEAVAVLTGVTLDEMRGERRVKHIVKARHFAMSACRKLTKHSYPEIARFFQKHHTTVLYGEERAHMDPDWSYDFDQLCDALRRVGALQREAA